MANCVAASLLGAGRLLFITRSHPFLNGKQLRSFFIASPTPTYRSIFSKAFTPLFSLLQDTLQSKDSFNKKQQRWCETLSSDLPPLWLPPLSLDLLFELDLYSPLLERWVPELVFPRGDTTPRSLTTMRILVTWVLFYFVGKCCAFPRGFHWSSGEAVIL